MGMENIVALYIRISLEDDDIQDGKEESDSVTNQRALLRRFVSGREDLAGFGVAEFLDDGYSGSNFDRPDFKRMMDERQKVIRASIWEHSRPSVTLNLRKIRING